MVHWLVEEGRLSPGEGEALGLTLPQSVRDAIGRRLDSLSPECNAMLRAAAVIGRAFAAPLLEHVTDTSGEATLELLGEALAAHVIVESEEGIARYAFSHALIRHTLYDELRVPQRVALHRSIGEAIEAGGASDADLAALAHHFFEAAPGGDVDRAIEACVQAAQRADRLFAYDEAVRHYQRALEALELQHPPDEARRCDLKLCLGEELWVAGEREGARECFFAVAEPARRLGDTAMLARAAVDLRGFGEMGVGPDETTLALLREAIDRIGGDSDLWRSRLLSRMAGSAPYANSMQTRRELSQEAYTLARSCGDVAALADALAARYWAAHGPDRVEERFALAEELFEAAAAIDEPRLRIIGHETRIGGFLVRGDIHALRQEVSAYSELAREMRMPLTLFLADLIEGSLALNLGKFDEARALFESSAGKGRGAVVYADVMRQGMLHWLRSLRGEPAAFTNLEATLAVLGREKSTSLETLMTVGIALGLRNEGDFAASRARFDAIARGGFGTLERDEHWLMVMSVLSELSLQLGDAERAGELYSLLEPYVELMCAHDLIRSISGSVRSALGQLALVRGDLALAETHLRTALERERAEELRPAACNTLGALAALHARRGQAGDRALAVALVAEADAEAVAMGSERRYGSWLELEKFS
jgi:tetratricopeptide (TPR) repeat protein